MQTPATERTTDLQDARMGCLTNVGHFRKMSYLSILCPVCPWIEVELDPSGTTVRVEPAQAQGGYKGDGEALKKPSSLQAQGQSLASHMRSVPNNQIS